MTIQTDLIFRAGEEIMLRLEAQLKARDFTIEEAEYLLDEFGCIDSRQDLLVYFMLSKFLFIPPDDRGPSRSL